MPQSSLAELARNSVLQSGFEMEVKRHWLGQKWYLPGSAGNDINKVRSLFAICALGVLGFFGDLGKVLALFAYESEFAFFLPFCSTDERPRYSIGV